MPFLSDLLNQTRLKFETAKQQTGGFVNGIMDNTRQMFKQTGQNLAQVPLGFVKGMSGIVESATQPLREEGKGSVFGGLEKSIQFNPQGTKIDINPVKEAFRSTVQTTSANLNTPQGMMETALNFSPMGIGGTTIRSAGASKAGRSKSLISKILEDTKNVFTKEPLAQEARKYKSAEEFVKAQGTPIYHGTSAKEFDEFSGINYFTKDVKEAKGFAEGIHLGGGKGGTTRVIEATHPMKKVKDIDNVVQDALIEGDLDQAIARELKIAQKEGYDTLSFTHPSNYTDGDFTAYVPIDNALIKTKSQLTDIWNKANKATKSVDPLAQEARKYKSAEEFVKAQKSVYHGTNNPKLEFKDAVKSGYADERMATFSSSDKQVAESFGKNIHELTPNLKNPLIIDAKKSNYYEIPIPKELRKDIHPSLKTIDTDSIVEIAQERGHDGVIIKNVIEGSGEFDPADARDLIIGLKKDSFLTKSQLTDIWNKARQAIDSRLEDIKKSKPAIGNKRK